MREFLTSRRARLTPSTRACRPSPANGACLACAGPRSAAALQLAADAGPAVASGKPLADLTAELADFQWGVSRPGWLSRVGTMLQDSTGTRTPRRIPGFGRRPRRGRFRAILERPSTSLVDSDADLEVAATLGTGSW